MSVKNNKNTFNINIEKISETKFNGMDGGQLVLFFSGKDLNVKILNSIKRTIMKYIPIYAYAHQLITIKKNTSKAFNNDMIIQELCHLPVMKVDPKEFRLDEIYYFNVDYNSTDRKIHPSEKNIELYLNVPKVKEVIKVVTTNDVRVTVDGEHFQMYDKKHPIQLIILKKDEELELHGKAVLGVNTKSGDYNVLWKGAQNVYLCKMKHKSDIKKNKSLTHNDFVSDDDSETEEKENMFNNEYRFTINGNFQIDEYTTIIRACEHINKLLDVFINDLKLKISRKEIEEEPIMHIKIDNMDYGIAHAINYEIQDHDKIISAGVSQPDKLVESVVFKVIAKSSPLQYVIESVKILQDKINHIKNNLNNVH
jgi:DNA-directed RNA polymerase subunit L